MFGQCINYCLSKLQVDHSDKLDLHSTYYRFANLILTIFIIASYFSNFILYFLENRIVQKRQIPRVLVKHWL